MDIRLAVVLLVLFTFALSCLPANAQGIQQWQAGLKQILRQFFCQERIKVLSEYIRGLSKRIK